MGNSKFLRFAAGRSDRRQYWACLLIVAFALWNVPRGMGNDPVILGLSLVSLGFALVVWPLTVARRLHDFGRTGWWFLAPVAVGSLAPFAARLGVQASDWLAPAINLSFHLLVGIVPGDEKDNRFGPPPSLQRADLETFD